MAVPPGPWTSATVNDTALYIYTSGTTGLPKAANVSHARVMQWSHWFAGLMDATPQRPDVQLPARCITASAACSPPAPCWSAADRWSIRERFSARQFWGDVVRWDCTLFQYIGELCRYLLQPRRIAERDRSPDPDVLRQRAAARRVERDSRNGSRIPRILEFYASTEGNVSLVNVEGKPGAIGRIPLFLAHRFPAALVRYDVDADAPVRDARGFCVRCAPNEAGEAIGQLLEGRLERGRPVRGLHRTRRRPNRRSCATSSSRETRGSGRAT